MAKKIKVYLIDDIDGSDATETISFAVDGNQYEIDLNDAHADELRDAFDKWVTHGRRVAASRGKRGAARPATGDPEAALIREWAKKNGYEISERGRIASEVKAAYAQRKK